MDMGRWSSDTPPTHHGVVRACVCLRVVTVRYEIGKDEEKRKIPPQVDLCGTYISHRLDLFLFALFLFFWVPSFMSF